MSGEDGNPLDDRNAGEAQENAERVAVEKVGASSELQLLRWENELLRREKDLYEREKSLSNAGSTSEQGTPSLHSSILVNAQDSSQFRMGISEARMIIEEFNPSTKSVTAKNWLQSLEGLKNVYGWDDRSTLFYATLRLGGAANYWYQSKQDLIKTFENFKDELSKSFPSGEDDASILIQIMERKRVPGEPIEDYLYHVASLAKKINLNEISTIRYIISGLSDQNLINVLMASQCEKISDLLVQIKNFEEIQKQGQSRRNLSEQRHEATRKFVPGRNYHKCQPYKNISNHSRRDDHQNFKESQAGTRHKEEKGTEAIKKGLTRCFKCNESGHYARNCTTDSPLRKCFNCNKTGHVAKNCHRKFVSHLTVDMGNQHTPKDEYHKIVWIEGNPILAFFDLGSECSTLREDVLRRNDWEMEKSEVKLVGFGGKQTNVLGKITKIVTVSEISISIDIMIVDNAAQSVPMIIGRNFMDRPDVQIIKRWGILEIKSTENISTKTDNNNRGRKDNLQDEDISFGSDVNKSDKDVLMKVINDFRDCFAKDITEVGKTNLVSMKIELKENQVVRYHPYKVAYGLKSVLRKSINDLLQQDIIQPSSSEYASPVLLIPKKNGEYRMCVDYRKLNCLTKREIFPVPNIEETLNSLANKKVFTTLDLLSGYHQVPIEKDSQHLTAFITPEGHFEFKRVPFGLTNSPAVFMKLMAKVIQPIGNNKIIVYMDDVLISSTTINENIETLKEFLTEIKKAGLTLNVAKCIFFQQKINFLGHEISEEGIKPGNGKIKAVREYKRPGNAREVKQFLGLTGYFRRFIKGFSDIARPLNMLLRKDIEFKWNEETETAFLRLKDLLSQRPVLALYDEKAKHEVHTDASSHGIAGILMQESCGDLKPVSYFSRATTSAESKYHSYELEALAVVESLERFKHYLLHRKFKVVTDCNSLRQTKEKKDLVPRIARWWLKISEFDFDLVFRPASKLHHADALSRSPVENGREGEDVADKMLAIGIMEEDWLAVLQKQDPRLAEIRKILNGDITVHHDIDGIKGNYILKDGRIFKKTPNGDRFAIPTGTRWRVIKSAHDDRGHPGVDRTLELLKKYVWFSSMKTVVKKYVDSCIDCLYNKRGMDETRYKIHLPERQPIPFHTIHIDHLGPYPKSKGGNSHIIGIVDAFTKYTILKAVRTTTSNSVIKLLEEVTQYFGMPTRVITDRGTAFTSREFERFCQENDIKHILTAVKTPRANGQIERYFRTTKAAIATMTQGLDGTDWDKNIRAIQWAFNSLKNSTTLVTPFQLIMTYHPRDILKNKLLLALHNTIEDKEEEIVPLSELKERVLNRMREKQVAQAEKFNSTHKGPHVYKEGDLVLIKYEYPSSGQPRKVQPRFEGPYVVKAVLPNDRYVVTDAEELQVSRKPYESVQAADRMKPWCNLEALNFDDGLEANEDENEVESK